jgi:hypothetical protein
VPRAAAPFRKTEHHANLAVAGSCSQRALRFLKRQVSDAFYKHYALSWPTHLRPSGLTQPSAREDGYPRR